MVIQVSKTKAFKSNVAKLLDEKDNNGSYTMQECYDFLTKITEDRIGTLIWKIN